VRLVPVQPLEPLTQAEHTIAQDARVGYGGKARKPGLYPAGGVGQIPALQKQLPNEHFGKKREDRGDVALRISGS
jgi:hypothetical protein